MPNRLCFVELPFDATAPAKKIYAKVFNFLMTDFRPTYSCTTTGNVDIGIQADANETSRSPLLVMQVDSLENIKTLVHQSGGTITKEIFSFPGGRGFHFRGPSGNELAAMQVSESS